MFCLIIVIKGYIDMNKNDLYNYINNSHTTKEECPYCHKTFIMTCTPQTPGFRMEEDLICPYCGEILNSSLHWEYYVEKENDNE